MADARIEELKALLPQCLLPDWVRLGSRLVRLFRDRHHPDKHDALLDRLVEQVRASVALREQRRINMPRLSYPPDLPITARKDDIVAAIRGNQIVIIAGETGSGKTTQIPKMCLEAGLGIEAKIGCTQPRRVAALSISRRIAEELNVAWGREVGCKIRFDDRSARHPSLMTDGILLAETQGDPTLAEYNVRPDEAHERSEHRLPPRLSEGTAGPAPGPQAHRHLGDHRYAGVPAPLTMLPSSKSRAGCIRRSDLPTARSRVGRKR